MGVVSRGKGITFRTDHEDDLPDALLWALQLASANYEITNLRHTPRNEAMLIPISGHTPIAASLRPQSDKRN